MRDIIALDEDDVVAIASRDLIDTHPLFARDRLLDSRTKAIPENNDKAFTTIITFYECNLEILWILLKDMDVLNPEGAKTKGKGKIKEFIRKRPNDVTIHQFEELCGAFWNALIDCFEDIYAYATAEPNAQPYRNRTGGNLLFRPVALLPFVRAAVKVSIQQQKNFGEIFGDFPQELLYIEISEYLGISFIQTKDFLKAAIQQSENRLSISDFFEDDFCSEVSALPQGLIQPGEELLDSVIASILEESVLETLSTLTPKEEKVLKLRFGIDDDCPRTLEETGNEFSITRERIRQIEVKALRKLRHPSRAKKLKDFWQ